MEPERLRKLRGKQEKHEKEEKIKEFIVVLTPKRGTSAENYGLVDKIGMKLQKIDLEPFMIFWRKKIAYFLIFTTKFYCIRSKPRHWFKIIWPYT